MTEPRFRHFWPELRALGALLATRFDQHAAERIAKGSLTEAEAEAGRRVMGSIAERWAWACQGPPPRLESTRAERIALLDQTLAGIRRAVERRPVPRANADYVECVETLLWWERQPRDIAWFAAFNDAARAQRAATPIDAERIAA